MTDKFHILGRLFVVIIIFNLISYLIVIEFKFVNNSSCQETVASNFTEEIFDDNIKLILFWTEFFGQPFSLNRLESCPHLNCTLTNDRSLIHKTSAVIYHINDLEWKDIPKIRFNNQRYVFLLHESPLHTDHDVNIKESFFNWTMTYRVDSDVPIYYGEILRKKRYWNITVNSTATVLNSKEILGKSKKLVAWVVSNCVTSSKREMYVKSLQKYLQVDIYGDCGPLNCSKSSQTECNNLIGDNYKFYLAFENSICKDYVTEKYFSRARINSVPIVLKRNYVENILPENSFIAADDFKNPKELASYLMNLNENNEKYLNYFKWRTLGYEKLDTTETGYCLLCKKLWNKSEPRKFYKKMSSWWSDNVCDVNFVERQINNL